MGLPCNFQLFNGYLLIIKKQSITREEETGIAKSMDQMEEQGKLGGQMVG